MQEATCQPDQSGRAAAAKWRVLLSLAICAAALVLPRSLAAQDAQVPWRLSYFPYFTVSPNDGLMGIARAIWFKQAPWGERITSQKSLALEAGYSTKDAWLARATWDDPTMAPDWRLKAHVEAGSQPRFGDLDPVFPLEHQRQAAWVDVTRHFESPLQLAVRAGLRHDRLRTLDGSYDRDDTDASLRGAVVLDLRDREYETNTGILLEFGGIAGSGGSQGGYAVPYAQLKGWLHPTLPLRLTGRLAWRDAISNDAIAPTIEFPGWERPYTILGGPHALRGLPIGAWADDGAMLAGIEARLDILNVGELGAVTVIGFVDGGKTLFGNGTVGLADALHPAAIAIRSSAAVARLDLGPRRRDRVADPPRRDPQRDRRPRRRAHAVVCEQRVELVGARRLMRQGVASAARNDA